jgi:hypothetical protein
MPLFDLPGGPRTHPWGNALRKAYLCNSSTKQIRLGDLLLFYRSQDARRVSAVGIVEATLRSTAGDEVAQFVGNRTVYALDEISTMCRSVRGVLAIRFRQDRFIEPALSLGELHFAGVVKSWPQSITRIPDGSMAWLRNTLNG